MKMIKNNLILLSLSKKNIPFFFLMTIIDNIFLGLLNSYVTVLFVKILFDKLESQAPLEEIMKLIGWLTLFFLLGYLFHVWYLYVLEPKAQYTLNKKIQTILFQKATELDLSEYDNPTFYNDFIWAMNEADQHAFGLLKDIGMVFNRVISVTTILAILFTIDPIIVISVIISVVLVLVFNLLRTNLIYKKDLDARPLKRKADYIKRVYYLQEYAKEIRLSDVNEILDREFNSVVDQLQNTYRKHGKKLTAMGLLYDISSSTIFNIAILLLLIYKIQVQNSISLGDFAATVGSSWKLFWQINSFMDVFSKLLEHSLYAEKFIGFMRYQSSMYETKDKIDIFSIESGLSLRNVSFRYPGQDNYVLKNITMDIKPNEKIALVGYNGAGKSTLIKLIMRLYDPTEGEILLDNVNIKQYSIKSYRALFGTVFQDFKIFAASVAENVMMDEYKAFDKKIVWDALRKSGMETRIKNSKKGLNTPVTREFSIDGELFSGGEMQKLAISRVFAKKSDILILDEPSSSLDADCEYELNQTIMSAADQKTVIFISHRLSTTTIADRIIMFENGEIIEQGSHNELMNLNGKYSEMFRLQSEKYNIKKEVTNNAYKKR